MRKKAWILAANCWLIAAATPVSATMVVISEIMYHPPEGSPEYLVIFNNSSTPFDIASWRFTDGIEYVFPEFSVHDPSRTFLKPFERIVVAGVPTDAVRTAFGFPASTRIFGPWSGKLDNKGERITLCDKNGVVMSTMKFGSHDPWPSAADGSGASLILKNANGTIDDWRNWSESATLGVALASQPTNRAIQGSLLHANAVKNDKAAIRGKIGSHLDN